MSYTPHELLNINCLQISVLYMSMLAKWCLHTPLVALLQQQFTPRVSNINRIADGGSFAMAIICTLICIHTKWTPLCLPNCICSHITYEESYRVICTVMTLGLCTCYRPSVSFIESLMRCINSKWFKWYIIRAVSYTHLTLPTKA